MVARQNSCNQDIIIDFKTTRAYNCPEGYDQLTDYSWPGNFAGCSCKINIGVYDYEVVLEVIHG